MREFIKKHNIENYFDELPDVNKKVLLDSTWEQDVWEIAKKHGLMLDEIEILVEEIGLVLLGVEPQSALQDNLRRHGNMHEKDLVSEMIREINIMVFTPMREKIQELLKHPHRDDIISAIEDKQSTKPQETVAHRKLSEIFSLAPATSDRSAEPPKTYAAGEDPYHEPID